MKWIVVAVTCLVLSGAGLAFAQLLPAQDPIAGSRVFGAKGCVRCHAVDGVGGRVGPDLARIRAPRSIDDLAAAMWNHLPTMADRVQRLGMSYPRLTPYETGDLIAFLFTLNYFDPPGNLERGRRLFVGKRCIVCHQVAGTGGAIGPNLDFLKQNGSPIAVAAAMWNHGPGMAEAMQARRIRRPTLTGSELGDLVAYLKSASPTGAEGPLYLLPGRADDGRRLFEDKGCAECHGLGAKGALLGPALADRNLRQSLTQLAATLWNKQAAMLEATKARGAPLPQLKADELADLVAYLEGVRYFAVAGDPGRGATGLIVKGCLTCHSIGVEGDPARRDLVLATTLDSPAVISALWNHAFLAARSRREGHAWPRYSPQEIADLVVFLQSLRPATR